MGHQCGGEGTTCRRDSSFLRPELKISLVMRLGSKYLYLLRCRWTVLPIFKRTLWAFCWKIFLYSLKCILKNILNQTLSHMPLTWALRPLRHALQVQDQLGLENLPPKQTLLETPKLPLWNALLWGWDAARPVKCLPNKLGISEFCFQSPW